MIYKRCWIALDTKKFSSTVQDMVQEKRNFTGGECDITSNNVDLSCYNIAIKDTNQLVVIFSFSVQKQTRKDQQCI